MTYPNSLRRAADADVVGAREARPLVCGIEQGAPALSIGYLRPSS